MKKKMLFVSDFDKTLSVGDIGHILSAKLGVSVEQFNRKIEEIKRRNQERVRAYFEGREHPILEWNRTDTEWLDIA